MAVTEAQAGSLGAGPVQTAREAEKAELDELRYHKWEMSEFFTECPQVNRLYVKWKLGRILKWAEEPTAGPNGPKVASDTREVMKMLEDRGVFIGD